MYKEYKFEIFQRKSSCCNVPKLISDDSLEDCRSQYPDSSSEEVGSKRKHTHCAMECYLNQTGIFQDGKPVKAFALDVLARSADAELTEVLNSAIDSCITELEKKEANKPPILIMMDNLDSDKCSPKTKFFVKCIETNVFINCPPNKKVSSEKCTRMMEMARNCKPRI